MVFQLALGSLGRFSAVPLMCLSFALAGCGTQAEPARPGARDTGLYPNVNLSMPAQTVQFSDTERDADTASLSAARASHEAQTAQGQPRAAADLRRLRQRHAQDALRVIEE